jgi:hypothetical protein
MDTSPFRTTVVSALPGMYTYPLTRAIVYVSYVSSTLSTQSVHLSLLLSAAVMPSSHTSSTSRGAKRKNSGVTSCTLSCACACIFRLIVFLLLAALKIALMFCLAADTDDSHAVRKVNKSRGDNVRSAVMALHANLTERPMSVSAMKPTNAVTPQASQQASQKPALEKRQTRQAEKSELLQKKAATQKSNLNETGTNLALRSHSAGKNGESVDSEDDEDNPCEQIIFPPLLSRSWNASRLWT